jgi:hypothetical protein
MSTRHGALAIRPRERAPKVSPEVNEVLRMLRMLEARFGSAREESDEAVDAE